MVIKLSALVRHDEQPDTLQLSAGVAFIPVSCEIHILFSEVALLDMSLPISLFHRACAEKAFNWTG